MTRMKRMDTEGDFLYLHSLSVSIRPIRAIRVPFFHVAKELHLGATPPLLLPKHFIFCDSRLKFFQIERLEVGDVFKAAGGEGLR